MQITQGSNKCSRNLSLLKTTTCKNQLHKFAGSVAQAAWSKVKTFKTSPLTPLYVFCLHYKTANLRRNIRLLSRFWINSAKIHILRDRSPPSFVWCRSKTCYIFQETLYYILKVSWSRKQILNFSFGPKNEQKYFCISALAS